MCLAVSVIFFLSFVQLGRVPAKNIGPLATGGLGSSVLESTGIYLLPAEIKWSTAPVPNPPWRDRRFGGAGNGLRLRLECDNTILYHTGVRVSAHVPAVVSTKQNNIARRGMRRDMVAPIWEGVTLIPDEISKTKSGEIVITAVLLHAVKILRAAGFHKQQVQVS